MKQQGNKQIIVVIIIAAVLAVGAFWLLRDRPWTNAFPNNAKPQTNQVDNDIGNQTNDQSTADDFLQYLPGLSSADKKKISQSDEWMNLLKIQAACNRLTGQPQQDCLTQLKLNQVMILNKPELCASLPVADECYYNLSIIGQNEQLCARINNQELKNECADIIYDLRAVSQTDLAFCDQIQDQSLKTGCYDSVISKKNDLAFCASAAVRQRQLEQRCREIFNFQPADDFPGE